MLSVLDDFEIDKITEIMTFINIYGEIPIDLTTSI